MPDHARWFATSAEGLAGVDAVAGLHAQGASPALSKKKLKIKCRIVCAC